MELQTLPETTDYRPQEQGRLKKQFIAPNIKKQQIYAKLLRMISVRIYIYIRKKGYNEYR